MIQRFLAVLLLLHVQLGLNAQVTVGLIDRQPGSEDGYVLFAPTSGDTSYLIDKCGRKVHQWISAYAPGQSVYLLADGSLLRTGRLNNPAFGSGGTGGIIERYGWNGQLLWSFAVSSATECQHHDIYPMPNGNVLVLAWDLKTTAEASAAGRDPARLGSNLWSEKILELQPVGTNGANIVWEWQVWDHLVQSYDATKANFGTVSQHPELINLNYTYGLPTRSDWLHCNALDYNEALDQIMVSCHNFSELWVIDHSTTTLQAEGHSGGRYGKGGDLLYRWGNPLTYGRGTAASQKFFGQHNARWIRDGLRDEGRIMVFNNGLNRPAGNFSSVEILAQEVDSAGNYPVPASAAFGPDSTFWKYLAPVPTDFYSANISGAQRLPSGNTLVCSGSNGIFFEIDTAQSVVWRYVSPVVNNGNLLQQGTVPTGNQVFRCTQYASDYPAFDGIALVPGNPVEADPLPVSCNMITGSPNIEGEEILLHIVLSGSTIRVLSEKSFSDVDVHVMDLQGRVMISRDGQSIREDMPLSVETADRLSAGIYLLNIHAGDINRTFRILLD